MRNLLSSLQFVVLAKNMTSEESVRLFPCKSRKNVFPGLRGIAFDIQDQLPVDDALCVFGARLHLRADGAICRVP